MSRQLEILHFCQINLKYCIVIFILKSRSLFNYKLFNFAIRIRVLIPVITMLILKSYRNNNFTVCYMVVIVLGLLARWPCGNASALQLEGCLACCKTFKDFLIATGTFWVSNILLDNYYHSHHPIPSDLISDPSSTAEGARKVYSSQRGKWNIDHFPLTYLKWQFVPHQRNEPSIIWTM